MIGSNNAIYREMVMDLLYRLRLADEQFCQVLDKVMAVMGTDDPPGKRHSLEQIHAYAQVLQIIYADFHLIIEENHAIFPADAHLWQWYEPDGEELIAQNLERLHVIAEGMEQKLNSEMLRTTARR